MRVPTSLPKTAKSRVSGRNPPTGQGPKAKRSRSGVWPQNHPTPRAGNKDLDCGGRAQRPHRFPSVALLSQAAWRCACRRAPSPAAGAYAAPRSTAFIFGSLLHGSSLAGAVGQKRSKAPGKTQRILSLINGPAVVSSGQALLIMRNSRTKGRKDVGWRYTNQTAGGQRE
jgi:hypothetical protein